jgi:hypothetical protein
MIGKAKAPAPQLEAWTRYLRILDADESEASDEEIAEVLYPAPGPNDDPVGSVADARKNANRWTKFAYYRRLLD